ncbi:VOC family protein [Phytohabitans flavus]|uniref:VOC family protein n=1 Tax=Phytohabitans flavus TaxID=1076124 RepID=UPI0036256A2E
MFDELFPILTTADLPRALRFYRDLLGGTVTYQFPPEGEPGYVGLDLGGSHLGIGRQEEPGSSSTTGSRCGSTRPTATPRWTSSAPPG